MPQSPFAKTLRFARLILVSALLSTAGPRVASAGPPYLSDDPQPTDEGHWEIYNFVTGVHDPGGLSGEAGVDLNYGGAKDLQLTAVLPLGYDSRGGLFDKSFRAGAGVIELAAKYKLLHQDDKGWTPDVAVFPRLFVPTYGRYGTGHVNLFLPVWAEKDFGPWQAFGGGGYQINPGPAQRSFWQGGVALNRVVNPRLQLGGEVFAQTRTAAVDGPGYVALNLALTYGLVKHWSLLASAGPTWESNGGHGAVFYTSLKADY